MLDIHIEHLSNPRNVGVIKNADLILETKSSMCGDMIKMYIKIDENKNITDVKYKVFGCWAVMVSCSMSSEYMIGKNLDYLKNISEEEFLKIFEYVPEIKERCFLLITEIFKQF